MAQFGDMLAELRQDQRLTQRDLAEALHISNSSISAYERGERIPDICTLTALADYFQVTTDYLVGRTEHNISPSVLVEPYVDSITLGELVKSLTMLSLDQRHALFVIVKNMRLVAEINQNK